MKIEYTPSENDMLTHQLLLTSQSKRVKKRRAQGKFFLLLIYMAMGIFIWERNGVQTAALFFIICLPLYFLYARMEKRQYIKHFKRAIQEHLKEQMTAANLIRIEPDSFHLSDGTNENIIPFSEVESIYEIKPLLSVLLKSGQSFYIPKEGNQLPSDLSSFLVEMTGRQGISYVQDLDWKWK